ncbi:helix-turn-helix domain-containing protein [Oscillospiraceae bacterium LCP21S3_A1]
MVVGDAVNSILSYEKKGDVVSANSLRDDIDRLCALLQCQPGDLVEYEEVKPDA